MWHGEKDHAAWTIQVPTAGSRDVYLDYACADGSAGNTFVLLEDVVAANLDTLFPGMEIVEVHPFRVTRNADVAPPVIDTTDLTREFGAFRAVDRLTLRVEAGRFYGFLGPNGAGKSTTIKCLTGLLRPTSGSCRILGLDPLVDPVGVKKRIGVVPEDLALFDRLTGAETLTFAGRLALGQSVEQVW